MSGKFNSGFLEGEGKVIDLESGEEYEVQFKNSQPEGHFKSKRDFIYKNEGVFENG